MRPRSPETEIRYLRRLLRMAHTGFRMLEDGPSRTTPEHPRAFEWNAHVQGYARTMVRLIRQELTPKRRRSR